MYAHTGHVILSEHLRIAEQQGHTVARSYLLDHEECIAQARLILVVLDKRRGLHLMPFSHVAADVRQDLRHWANVQVGYGTERGRARHVSADALAEVGWEPRSGVDVEREVLARLEVRRVIEVLPLLSDGARADLYRQGGGAQADWRRWKARQVLRRLADGPPQP